MAFLGDVSHPETAVKGAPSRVQVAEVVAVNTDDGTIDASPLNGRATKVHVRYPTWWLPQLGERCLLADRDGDPRQPICLGYLGPADGSTTGPQIQGATASDASTTVKGITKLSVAPVSPTSPVAVGDNDPRNTNARTPTGAAGGELAGTYPNPTLQRATNTVFGASKLSVAPAVGGTPIAVGDNDSRMTNARTPTAHASTHAAAGSDPVTLSESQITNLVSDLAAKAPLASPTFTGDPKAPTPAAGDNDFSIATTAFVTAAVAVAADVGDLKLSARASAPSGWLLCDGSPVSRTGATAALFAAIGTTFGAGDGSTTFNLPDFRGRSPVGLGLGTGLTTTRALGDKGGEETHALTLGELATHDHGAATGAMSANATHDHGAATGAMSANSTHAHGSATGTPSATHTHSGTTGNNSVNHTHGGTTDGPNSTTAQAVSSTGFGVGYTVGGTSPGISAASAGGILTHTHTFTTGANSVNHTHSFTSGTESATHTHSISTADLSHTHSIASANLAHTHSISPAGSGTGHNTMPPFLAVNVFIKT